jgi:serine/threonine protein kinase
MFADRYELGAPLGRGGMAEVFEAVAHGAHGFERRVAIKRLLPEIGGDPDLVRRFLDEARIASHLHHAGIVAVLDYGVVEGAPFQVLELVEGANATTLLRSGASKGTPMPVEVALAIATETAHALAYAHERHDIAGRPLGIVHRDVKPSNVLVSRSGDIKLGDFGIALARERIAVTTGIVVRGTPGYMSPEQLLGVTIGPETDIFALGVTLNRLLGNELDTEGAHRLFLSGQELPISPAIPTDVREIIVRATRARSDERYPSARAMAHALGKVLAPRLDTDPKTRVTQWLAELAMPRKLGDRTVTSTLVAAGPPHQFVRSSTEPFPRPRESSHAAPKAMQQELSSTVHRTEPRPPTSRSAIFGVALLIPLALAGVVVLVVFSSLRTAPVTSLPKPTSSAALPSAIAEPTSSPSLLTAPPQPQASASTVIASPKQKEPESIDFVVRSLVPDAVDNQWSLEQLDASPEEQSRVVSKIEGQVRPCLVGQRARRGAMLVVRLTLDEHGGVTKAEASNVCHGRYCSASSANETWRPEWIPLSALDCMPPKLAGLQLRPYKSDRRDELFFHFGLR